MISPLIQQLLPSILVLYIVSKVRGHAAGCCLHCSASDDGHRAHDECAVASYAAHSAAQHTQAQLNANESEQLSWFGSQNWDRIATSTFHRNRFRGNIGMDCAWAVMFLPETFDKLVEACWKVCNARDGGCLTHLPPLPPNGQSFVL